MPKKCNSLVYICMADEVTTTGDATRAGIDFLAYESTLHFM